MKKVVKRIVSSPLFWLTLFSCVYFISRYINILSLPIFTDEAIYVRWAQIGGTDASWRFISLTDGKQPMFTWMMMVMLRFIKEPLLAGRLTSVFGGFFAMAGMYMAGSTLFKSKRVGVLCSLLYLLSPYALMYDRMALYDSWVAAFSVWNLYLSILLVRLVRLDVALLLGMMLGAAMLNKTSGFLSLYSLPMTLLLFDFRLPNARKRLFKWIGLVVVAGVLSQLLYSILRLSPFFYIIAQKDTIFVYPFFEWLTHPWRFFWGNFHGILDWLISYETWPVILCSFFACSVFWKQIREKRVLVLWFLMPAVGLALFGRVLYPRFILFMVLPVIILSAKGVSMIWDIIPKKVVAFIIIFLLLIKSTSISYKIITDITHAPITKSDQGQYVNDWPSGWGVREIVAFLSAQSQKEKISVYTEGTFGLFPYALEIYLVDNKNISIYGLWPLTNDIPKEMTDRALQEKTYMVFNLTQVMPNWPLRFISKYQKGSNTGSHMSLYEVVPADAGKSY